MNNKHTVFCGRLQRIAKILKTALLLLVFCLSQVCAQTTSFSITAKKETLESVIKQIEKQSNFLFFYNIDEVNKNEKISVNLKSKTIQEVLNVISAQTGLKYVIKDRHIVLSSHEQPAATAVTGMQQVRKISGIVKDAYGETIIGANVKVKGGASGTITNIEGQFVLEAPQNATLHISYIGYLPQEIAIKNQSVIVVTLKEDNKMLDEVVVIGYGTMKKKDLTGAVSSVKLSDTPVGVVSTISNALAGKAAGLQVNMDNAQPGGGSTFRIRGAGSINAGNDPLIIIDGFPVSDPGNIGSGTRNGDAKADNILSSINPSDIESIEVLKDASSTAIYGSRAGHGVIIITTKRGKSGNAKVQYSGTASVQTMAKKYEMLDAVGFMTETNNYRKNKWMIDKGVYPYGNKQPGDVSPAYVQKYSQAEIDNPAYNTNCLDEITRLGFQTQHNLSINGGTENTQYLVSGNYLKQDGIVKKNAMERYSGRINLDQRLSRYIKTGISLTLARNQYDNIPMAAGEVGGSSSILGSAARFNPLMPIRDENGKYTMNPAAAFFPNPASMLEIIDKTTKERLLGSIYFEVEPIKDLKLKANFGLDRNYQKRRVYFPKTTLFGEKSGGEAAINQSDRSDYLTELTINYNKEIQNHSFSVLGGYSYQLFDQEALGGGNNNFLIDGFLYNNLGAGGAPKPTVSSSASKDRLASFFARMSYSFLDRYLLTATVRADGSSNFAKSNRWGFFPSVAMGWRFSEENFMLPLKDVISNAKLRVSYGETGNANVGNKAISFYQVGNNNIFGDTESKGVYLSQMGNPNLKWETTKEWNFGLDIGLFNNRINITAEYFNRVIADLLNDRILLSYNEVTQISANVGSTQSRGFELTINSLNIKNRSFSWNTDLTYSLYRDKWKSRDVTWKPTAYSIYDAPLRGYYGYRSDGLIQIGETVDHMPGFLPGQVKLKDLDGFVLDANGNIVVDATGTPQKTGKPDGKLDDADKEFYGSSDPQFLLGMNNSFQYKNFDLNIYIHGQFGKLVMGDYRTSAINLDDFYTGINNPAILKEMWGADNTTGTIPGVSQSKNSNGYGDYYLEKIWFVKVGDITLGYNIPMGKAKKFLSNIRVYANVSNPFTLTPYKGLDPESGTDNFSYPSIRSYSIGLDISF